MNAWDAPEGGPCFFRPAPVGCPDRNPAAEEFTVLCFDKDKYGNFTKKPGLDSCCEKAFINERGIQIGGCKQTSVWDYYHQCIQGSQGISVLLNMEYGFYYNISVDEYHRPHGCPVSKILIFWYMVMKFEFNSIQIQM